jgi:hypothetical protein
MKIKDEKFRRIGAFFLDAMIVVFMFANSFVDSAGESPFHHGTPVLQETPSAQILLQEPSSCESLVGFFAKVQLLACTFVHDFVDQQTTVTSTSFTFSVDQHVYNTFYKHVTTNAP